MKRSESDFVHAFNLMDFPLVYAFAWCEKNSRLDAVFLLLSYAVSKILRMFRLPVMFELDVRIDSALSNKRKTKNTDKIRAGKQLVARYKDNPPVGDTEINSWYQCWRKASEKQVNVFSRPRL